MNYFLCPLPCHGEIAPGGKAPPGGGECLRCGRVFASTSELLAAGGSAAQICNRGRRPKPQRCQEPGCPNEGIALCDEPVDERTCDRRICSHHRTRIGVNRDRCPAHTPAATEAAR